MMTESNEFLCIARKTILSFTITAILFLVEIRTQSLFMTTYTFITLMITISLEIVKKTIAINETMINNMSNYHLEKEMIRCEKTTNMN